MQYPWIVIVGILAAAALYVLLPVVLSTFLGYRGRKVVTCPETGGPAEVGVDAARAAAGSALGRLVLKAKSCSLWPARSGCAQRCLETSDEARQESHQARTR